MVVGVYVCKLVSCHHDIIEDVGGGGVLKFLTVIVEVMHFQ